MLTIAIEVSIGGIGSVGSVGSIGRELEKKLTGLRLIVTNYPNLILDRFSSHDITPSQTERC